MDDNNQKKPDLLLQFLTNVVAVLTALHAPEAVVTVGKSLLGIV